MGTKLPDEQIAFLALSIPTNLITVRPLPSGKDITRAINNHQALVDALRLARRMNQYIVGLSDRASVQNARDQARQAITVLDAALAAVEAEK